MAASIRPASMADISSILECKVCLRRLHDPKQLFPCHHIFCRECLEGVMKFRKDGSIDIPCPNRCPKQMHLDKNQTVGDLGTAYEIKAIIETLQRSDDENSVCRFLRCGYTEDCGKTISVYCCGHKMCRDCSTVHNRDCSTGHNSSQGNHEGRVSMRICEETGDLVVMCAQHSSRCTHLCTNATHNNNDTFLCVYCINRDHKEHSKDTIEEQAKKLKETLISSSRHIEKLNQLQKVTEDEIALCKTKLDKLLRQRKEERVSEYIDLLNREEEMIKTEFLRVSDEHLKQYPNVINHSFYEEKLAKDGIDLVIEKTAVLNTIFHHNFLQLLDISLSNSIDVKSKQPLGSVDVKSEQPLGSVDVKSEQPLGSADVKSEHPLGSIDAESEHPLGILRVISRAATFADLDVSISTLQDSITTIECSNDEISSKLAVQLKELMQIEKQCDHSDLLACSRTVRVYIKKGSDKVSETGNNTKKEALEVDGPDGNGSNVQPKKQPIIILEL